MAKTKISDDQWLQTYWRPAMAWAYLFICVFDFMAAPISLAWFSYFTKTSLVMWTPLTIQGGGLFHLAMGAIIGITSYAKTQERVSLIKSPFLPGPGQIASTTPFVTTNGTQEPER
jgi:hypothetical protein